MPHADVKAEMRWEVWPLKAGRFCSGCRKKLGESAVMVTVLFPGLEPMPAKKYCQHCFDSMCRFWEKHQLIQTTDSMQKQREETERLNARIAELESQLRFYVGIAVDEAKRQSLTNGQPRKLSN